MWRRDSGELLIIGVVWVFLLLPAIPVGMGWLVAARDGAGAPGRRTRLTLLVLLTASQLLLLARLAWAPVIGRDYSPRRFATITINLVVMAATTLVAARTRGPGRGVLVIAGAWLTLAWFYVLAISSVV